MRKIYSILTFSILTLLAYNSSGQDCDYDQSSLYFDMDQCQAIFGFPSQTEYDEFTAVPDTFPGGTILSVVGGNLYRENGTVNMHSCTESYDTTYAMCVGSLESCDYVADSDKAVRFDIKVELGDDGVGRLSGLSFYESSQDMFNWVNGSSGPNNYPTRYAIRVSVNGTTIFEEIDIETTSDWTEEVFDFSGLEAFRVTQMTEFNFELLPYCLVGIDSPVNAWDLDNIVITANAIDNVAGGELTFGDGAIEKEICVGDEVADNMNVALSGTSGSTSTYLITDEAGVILAYDVSFPFDFEGSEGGTCLIWNISYYDSISGTDVGNNASDITGCYELSNPITLLRNEVDGGIISGGPFEFCSGDGIVDNIDAGAISLTGNIGTNGTWVVTDSDGNILGLPADYTNVDFDEAGVGTCLVWYLSFEDGIAGASIGANAADLEGCYNLSNPIEVIRNERPNVTIDQTAITCGSDNGTATAMGSDGESPYSYLWSNGDTGESISNLAAGTYTVTITDANGCTNEESVTIEESTQPTVATSSADTTCGEDNGSASATVTDGAAPYTYAWSNGMTGANINGLPSGDYTVTVTDSNGCTDSSTTTIDPSTSPIVSVSGVDTGCAEDNGTATATTTDGQSPYTYLWSTGATSDNVSGLGAGSYEVTVTDALGCTDTGIVVLEASSTPDAWTDAIATTCGEDNGSVSSSATGGILPYTYEWSTGSTEPSLFDIEAGTYTVTITDTQGCTSSSTIVVEDSTAPIVSTAVTSTTCGEDNGALTASTTSGVAPYTYIWSNGSTSSMLNNLEAGDYTVTVTDAEGCTDVSSATVNPSEASEVSTSSTSTTCGEDNGTATATVTSGTAPYTYLWSTGSTSASMTGLASGSYTVTITDAAGCEATSTTSVGASTAPIASTSSMATTCGEDNGTATATGTSGTAPYTYLWSTGSTSASMTGLASGSYTVTITDAAGCEATSTTSVGASTAPIASTSSMATTCGEDNGTATATVTSGTAPYTYLWSTGSTSASMIGLASGSYTVTITDAAGCEATSITSVGASTAPIASTSSTATTCGEDNGTATATGTSGTAPYTYLWSTGSTSASMTGLASGSYTVTITDAAGCEATSTTSVGASTAPIASTSSMATTCGEDNGTATATGTSGTAPYTYLWSTGSTSASMTGLASGSYTVTITDAAGCEATSTTSVGASTAPIASTSSMATTCGEDNGTATATGTSGTAPYTYLWSTGSTSASMTGLASGSYTVTITDAAGCEATSTTSVGASTAPIASTSSMATTCGEDNGTATATGTSGTAPYTYLWSTGSTSASMTGLASGSYTVTITDAAGCEATSTTSVGASTAPIASTSSMATTCGEDNGTATATGTSGTAPYTYLWSTGSTSASMTGLASGSYTVTITDAAGCEATSTTSVGASTAPIASTSSMATTCGEDNGTATATVTSGTAPYTYLWSTGSTSASMTGLASGSYTVTITDAAGCEATSTTSVGASTAPIASTSSMATTCGEDNGTATATGTSGTAPYTYLWSTGSTSASMTGLASGSYTVTITDAAGCEATSTTSVGASTAPIASTSSTATTCGEDNGTATATVTSGTAPYTYLWSTGSTSASMTGLVSGSYTVTITDAAGCTATSTTMVGASNTNTATASSFDTCCGEDNGSATASAVGGTAPYSFVWSNGSILPALTGLSAGNYTVTVTDAAGCSSSATTNVGSSTTPMASTSSTATTCGEDNGTATATVTSGEAPYSYLWSNDENGGGSCEDCIQTVIVPIAGADPIIVEEVMVDGSVLDLPNYPYDLQDQAQAAQFLADCLELGYNVQEEYNPATGKVAISVLYPGQNFDSFNINGGEQFFFTCSECVGTDGLNNASITGLAAGSYTVTVTDSEGCTSTSTTVVADSSTPIATTTSTATTCGEDNGTVSVSVSSGTAPYTYLWSTGSTSSSMNSLGAGDYTVTVTDADGCTDVSTTNVGESNAPEVTTTSTDTSCGEDNGTATASVVGGTAPYTYLWSTGGTSSSMSGLSAGTYSVTITDAAGCTSSSSTSVSESTAPISNASSTDTMCGEDNGSAEVTVTSGTAPYTYLWSTGNTSASMSGLAAGTYTVTVTDANGCTSESSVSVGDSSNPTVSVESSGTTCGDFNGTVTATGANGVEPYTYEWSNGFTGASQSNLLPDDYIVTVTDANGCTAVLETWIDESNAIEVNMSSTNTTCEENNGTVTAEGIFGTLPFTYEWFDGSTGTSVSGLMAGTYSVTVTDAVGCTVVGSAEVEDSSAPVVTTDSTNTTCGDNNGGISASVTGGTAPYSYLWSNGATTQDLVDLASGTYTVTVTDAAGCTSTTMVTIGESINISAAVNSIATSCDMNNGSATASASNGAAPYTYLWSNGSEEISISNLEAGTYTVTITDANGCIDEVSTVVAASEMPSAVAVATATECGEDNGSLSVGVNGGIAPYTFIWSNGSTENMINGVSAGSYSVTVTDAAGCTVSRSTTVEGSSAPTVSLDNIDTSCGEDNGSATAVASGGVAPYTYAWSNGANASNQDNLAAGTYSITVTDAAGCTVMGSVTIDDSTSPIVSVTTNSTTCGEDNGSATASTTEGQAPYTYLWSSGETDSTINGVSAGTYTVTVTDANGCTDVSSTSINNSSSPEVTINSISTTCGNNNGSASASVSSGTAPYTYLWSTMSEESSIGSLAAGTYTVTIIDANGCTVEGTATIQGSDSPTVTIDSEGTTCGLNNGSASASTTGGTAPYTYAWSNGSANASLSGLASGEYEVTVTDAEGCTDVSSTTIANSDTVNATAIATATTCNESNGTATAFAEDGTMPYSYLWSNGAITSTITSLAAGEYQVTITDAAGCTDVASTNVDGSSSPSILVGSAPEICGTMNGAATVSISSGTAPYTILWSNGSTEETQMGLSGGTYSVTVTDSEGCTAVGSIEVEGSIAPDGGVIDVDGEVTVEFCQEGTMDMLSDLNLVDEEGSNMTWIITDIDGNILHLLDDNGITQFDFEDQSAGTCLVWHLSYEDVMNLSVGNNASELTGCFDLSNSIAITKYDIVDISESSLIIDMDMCASNGITNEPFDYSEFIAEIDNDDNCATLSVVGGNLYRDNPNVNSHSCTEGVNGSVAMCVSSDDGCDYNPSSDNAIKLDVEIVPAASGSTRLTEISFFEKAPEAFDWINGNAGPNNYPTQFGVRVLKGSEVIFQQSGNATMQEWNERIFTFTGDDFLVTEATTFTIELLAYCIIDNGFPVTAWDIDDLSLVTECENIIEEGTLNGGPYEICSDGLSDFITDVTLEGAEGDIIKLVLVDADDAIIATFDDVDEFATFDFEPLENETWNLYAISAGIGFSGCDVGNTFKLDFEGCYKLSNSIMITKLACGTVIGTYPNPTNAMVRISNIHTMEGSKTVSIYDAMGRLIRSYQLSEDMVNNDVDLTDCLPGIYTIQIITANGQKVTKSVMKVK